MPLPLTGLALVLALVGIAFFAWQYFLLRSRSKQDDNEWPESPALDEAKHAVAPPPMVEGATLEQYKEKLSESIKQVDNKLDLTLEALQAQMTSNLNSLQEVHKKFVNNLEEMALNEQKNTQERINTKINEMLLNFEQNLTGFLSNSEQKSLEAINIEVRSARQLIDNYKAQQLAIIDENIVSVLERTLELVLKEKLTLKNQLDLVYEALEKAKVEKFFV